MHTQPPLSTRPSYHRINSDAGWVCRCIGPLCKTMVGMLGYKSYGSGFLTIIISRLLKPGNAHWSHRSPGANPTTPPDTAPTGPEELIDPGRVWWATTKNPAPRMRRTYQPGHEGAGRLLCGLPPHEYQGELVHQGDNPIERSECRMVLLNFFSKNLG